jgi:hypothetical protein
LSRKTSLHHFGSGTHFAAAASRLPHASQGFTALHSYYNDDTCSFSQHFGVCIVANLYSSVWRKTSKFHHINPDNNVSDGIPVVVIAYRLQMETNNSLP